MKIILNNNITDPAINLALEEHALKSLDLNNDYLLFYINEPSVIVGKHQNTIEEINHEHIKQNDIHVVRRMSGGGAVYHDHGNLNFSFICRADKHIFNRYETFTQPIIEALHDIGVPAELNGRNDMTVHGKKISGIAQYQIGDRMFCHGTLLFDSCLDNVQSALNVKAEKIESKGIKSIRSRVTNIKEHLSSPLNIAGFKNNLIQKLCRPEPEHHEFSQTDWQHIKKLTDEKYRDWHWNFGKSPKCNIQNRKRFPVGEIDVRILVENGAINAIKFFGDFFAKKDISELESSCIGLSYDYQTIDSHLKKINLEHYFGEIDSAQLTELLIG